MMVRRIVGLWLAAALAAAGLGCSGDSGRHKVKGKVTLDGQPLQGAEITFIPSGSGEHATGFSGADGTFEVNSTNAPGAAPGDYKVVIVKMKSPELTGEGESQKSVARAKAERTNTLPKKYADAATTPLSCKVPPPSNLTFDLKSDES